MTFGVLKIICESACRSELYYVQKAQGMLSSMQDHSKKAETSLSQLLSCSF